MLNITHHGGAKGVTGSCHQLTLDSEHSLLIDCGLFQGEDATEDAFQQLQIEFDISTVKALVITHVHIDHVGRLPYLLAPGSKGRLSAPFPRPNFAPGDRRRPKNRLHPQRTIDRALPAAVESQIVSVLYGKWHTVVGKLTKAASPHGKTQAAGHILGSSYVEVAHQYPNGEKERVIFSGDLGAPYAPLLPAPNSPYGCEQLVLESTYGDRHHPDRRQRRATLKQAIEQALTNGGTVMVPAFSIGRTQSCSRAGRHHS